jgi:hypothetical protein
MARPLRKLRKMSHNHLLVSKTSLQAPVVNRRSWIKANHSKGLDAKLLA